MTPLGFEQMEAAPTAGQIRAMFGRIAHRYDLINSLISLGRDSAWREMAVELAQVDAHSSVIDVATGTAELAIKLALSTRSVLAVDFCQEMMSLARQKVKNSGVQSKVQFVLGDALLLPFRDSSFDSAVVGFGMRNVVSIADCFAELRRIIKPGGYVVCLELTRPASPIFAALHRFYLRRIIPLLGNWMSGDDGAYSYLPDSISRFPTADQLESIMEMVGLRHVGHKMLNWGAVSLHTGVK